VDASPSSAYRVCLSQLAFFTSHPRLAASLVAALGKPKDETDPDDVPGDAWPGGITLGAWFREHVKNADLQNAAALFPNREQMQLEPFRRWLPLTSRYLFHRTD
jgi:hypothetical protein